MFFSCIFPDGDKLYYSVCTHPQLPVVKYDAGDVFCQTKNIQLLPHLPCQPSLNSWLPGHCLPGGIWDQNLVRSVKNVKLFTGIWSKASALHQQVPLTHIAQTTLTNLCNSPLHQNCSFLLPKNSRSMETGHCSIYRELLRLHFSDEQTFCEDGILAEVLFSVFIFIHNKSCSLC